MFAVIRAGGKQYKVAEGDTLDIELQKFNDDGKTVSIAEQDVLMIVRGEESVIGKPFVAGASVGLELVENFKAKKVIAFKYRRREGYHRTVGHRQQLSRVRVTSIAG